MSKRVLLILLAVALAVSLAAFGACGNKGTEPPAQEWQWPERLLIATPGMGGLVYGVNIAWTAVFQQQTGVQVRVVPDDNEVNRHRMVKEGTAFMNGVSGGGSANFMAQDVWATRDMGPQQLRQIWTITSGATAFFVRGDSSIKTVYDIKPGVRIAYISTMPAILTSYESLLAWAGLKLDDAVKVPFGDFSAMLRSIPGGQADICWCPDPTHAQVFEAEAAPNGIRWIDLDPEKDPAGAARWLTISPTTIWGTITYGVPSGIGHKGTQVTSPYCVREDADPELVYHLVKWLHENFDAYKDKHTMCPLGMSLETYRGFLSYTFTPVHEGSIRYLKEIGKWTVADDLRQEYNVNLLTRYCQAYEEAIARADQMGIPVTPVNKEWIALWENYKTEIGIPKIMAMSDTEISKAMAK